MLVARIINKQNYWLILSMQDVYIVNILHTYSSLIKLPQLINRWCAWNMHCFYYPSHIIL